MSKRVYIYAYAQMNLGDDLFIKILCDRYPHTKFYIMSNKKYSISFNEIDNLTVINNIPVIDGAIKRTALNVSVNNLLRRLISFYCDATVTIGGSIFQEKSGWKNKLNVFQKRLINKKKHYIIGSNFGPYKDNQYYEKYKSAFKAITDICFRDSHSYNLFSDLPNVRYEADVVFQYSYEKIDYQNKQVVISVIGLKNRDNLKMYENSYQEKIIELSRYFVKQGFSVYLMGFCEKEGDDVALSDIYSKLSYNEKDSIKKYSYQGDIDKALKLIQESQYILATRFHSMILGWVFNKPVYPIVYNDKITNVLDDIGFQGSYVKIKEISTIQAEDVYNNLTTSKPLNINQQIISSKNQFKMLDEFLL